MTKIKKTTVKKNPAARALGRLGGQAGTAAQNAARRQNAQRAGRPGRVCSTCEQPVFGGHKNKALDRTCAGREWQWRQQSEK